MKPGAGRNRFPSPQEFQKLLKACGKDMEAKVLCIVLGTTTARKSELLKRKWSEVFLNVPAPYPLVPCAKNSDPQFIPLSDAAVAALRRLPSLGKHEYLFPAKRPRKEGVPLKHPYRTDLRKKWANICKRAKLSDLHIHDLRHMGASILFCLGVPDPIIAKLTGHRGRTLDRYKHMSPAFRAQTVDLISRVLLGQTGKSTCTPACTPTQNDTKRKKRKRQALKGRGFWWARRDSNSRPLPCQGSALTN